MPKRLSCLSPQSFRHSFNWAVFKTSIKTVYAHNWWLYIMYMMYMMYMQYVHPTSPGSPGCKSSRLVPSQCGQRHPKDQNDLTYTAHVDNINISNPKDLLRGSGPFNFFQTARFLFATLNSWHCSFVSAYGFSSNLGLLKNMYFLIMFLLFYRGPQCNTSVPTLLSHQRWPSSRRATQQQHCHQAPQGGPHGALCMKFSTGESLRVGWSELAGHHDASLVLMGM